MKFESDQIKNNQIIYGPSTQSISPTARSTLVSAYQAFACSNLVDQNNSEGSNQIDSSNQHQFDKLQKKKHKDEIQQHVLLDLHQQLGNKWTDIALRLQGWDHNSVKNYFYAKIRKSLRRISCFAKKFLTEKLKALNMCHVSKMITTLSEKKPEDSFITSKQNEIQGVKRFLFKMSQKKEDDELNQNQLKQLKATVNKIFELIDQVKKNCSLNKKNKKKQQKKIQKGGKCIRESTTVKATKQETDVQIKVEPENLHIYETHAYSQMNYSPPAYWVMLMPYQEMQMNQNLIKYQPVQMEWTPCLQNYVSLDSHIFGNS